MRQYTAIKKNYPDCLLFFRMGDFYELFQEDAKIAAKALNVALTSRSKTKNEPMCGVPYHSLATYLERAVRAGHKVAICEQVEDPRQAKGIVKREVVRVVTPGTLTEDYLLDEKEPNYLASISVGSDSLGLAVIDLSTGTFLAREFDGDKRIEKLIDDIARFSPKEVIVPDEIGTGNKRLLDALDMAGLRCEPLDAFYFSPEEAVRELTTTLGVGTLEGFGLSGKRDAVGAAGAAVSYIRRNSPSSLGAVDSIRFVPADEGMEIDAASVRNLELVSNLSNGSREGTLIEIIDQTKTGIGARLLRERVVKPLTGKDAILKRLSLVTAFFEDFASCGEIRNILSGMSDFERAFGRIAGKNFNPRDFSSLCYSLELLPKILEALGIMLDSSIKELAKEWDNVEELASLLQKAVNRSHPATFREVGFINDGYNAELDELRSFVRNVTGTIKGMEETEKIKTGIPSLKFSYNKIYGYFIEITKKHADKVPESYIRKQSLVNCERFVSQELKELEEKLAGADEKSKELEARLIDKLRLETLKYLPRVRKAAKLTAKLDISAGLAETARLNDYSLPEITEGRELELESSRHPVIERLMIEETFVPNDISIGKESRHLMIITGPNMAGKSTYLRQVALAVLMAQIGSYVAAKKAVIGIADRIFTRVGAQDRLQKGLSTFMVEMVETANILNNATERSFVILDEIGRGTSTFDGVSIAWAVAEFLAKRKTRTLFATHYHELTDLTATQDGVANFNVSAREYKDKLVFMRKLEEGPADKSYGIQVARLAGLPKEVLESSKRLLAELEKMEYGSDGKPVLKAQDPTDDKQFSLFDARSHPVVDALRDADIDSMTPLEALNLINKMRDMLDPQSGS